ERGEIGDHSRLRIAGAPRPLRALHDVHWCGAGYRAGAGTGVVAATLQAIEKVIEGDGLRLRGGFHTEPGDAVPMLSTGKSCASLVMIGNVGGSLWSAFSGSPEYGDGKPHALDRWTRRVIDRVAAEVGAEPLYPFGGPPWHPFQRWAQRAEPVTPSPIA